MRKERLGAPGIVEMARGQYVMRVAELEKENVVGDAADDRILREARLEGGALEEGESIDLSVWAEQLEMRRDVLEALVLAIRRREAHLSAPPVSVFVIPTPPKGTPAVSAPPARLPVLSTPDVFEIVGYANQDWEQYIAYFRFPDRDTMMRCIAPLGLGDSPSPNPIPLRMGLEVILRDLDLVLRLGPDETGPRLGSKDAEAAREIAHALAGLELLSFRVAIPEG